MAMLKNKPLAFSLILVCLIVVSPMAKAQLIPGIPPPPTVPGLINVITINGVVTCTLNATASGVPAPPFAGATVQLQCGPTNAVVGTTTTNLNGVFSLPTQTPLTTLLSNCTVVVTTPLSTCNATLPSVNLTSTLTVVGSLITGIINFILIVPSMFTAIPVPV